MKNFPINLKKLREEQNLSQKKLGQILGLPQSNIGMYESGKRMPPPKILDIFADYFNVTVDYLLGRTDTPMSKPFSEEKIKEFKKGLDDLKLDQYKELNDENKEFIAVQFNALIDKLKDKK